MRPHGLQALFALRLEKGHVIVGMDTEMDSTPRRLNMDWAVKLDKPTSSAAPHCCAPQTSTITVTCSG